MGDLRAQIVDANVRLSAYYKAGDFTELAKQIYAEDCKMVPPSEPVIHGNINVAKELETYFKKGALELLLSTDEVLDGGNFAIERGRYDFVDADRKSTGKGNYVQVWKKVADTWLLYFDCYN